MVALYCKQRYVTSTLYYMHHNNDIIMHVNVVKTFWHPLLLILW